MKKTLPVITVLLIALLAFTGCEPGNTPEPDVWSGITSLDQLVGTWEFNGTTPALYQGISYTLPNQKTKMIEKEATHYSVTEIDSLTLPDQSALDNAKAFWTEIGNINKVVINGLTATFTEHHTLSTLNDASDYRINQYGNKLHNINDWSDHIFIKQ